MLGLAFMSPALLLLAIFFLLPVVLTSVFAFTNMSTATGISGGSYVISSNLLRTLDGRGVDKPTLEALGQSSFVVNDSALAAARAADVDAAFVDEIEQTFAGESFATARDFERALKQLSTRPSRTRDLKLALEPFEQSVLNIRFGSRGAAEDAVAAFAPAADPAAVAAVIEESYTGWVWTGDNFRKLLFRQDTWRIVGNTVFYVASTLSFTVLVGLFLAISTFYLPRGAGNAFSMLWLLPRITPVVLYAVMWKWFTWEDGFVSILADQVGLPAFNYMKGSVPTAWTVVILVNGFIGASFAMILFTGALRAIPKQQLWASEVDGASRWQQVRYVILPQLRWPILFVTSYQTLSLLTSYQEIWLTTNGGPGSTTTVWALEAFLTALSNYSGNLQYGMGAAMALILVTVGLGLSIIYLRLFKFDDLITKPKIEF